MYFFHNQYNANHKQLDKLIKQLDKIINNKHRAIHCYDKIAQLARSEKERKQILLIRKDEQKHYKLFAQLYTQLTGMQLQPNKIENCPNSYRKGIEFAFREEQQTVSHYLKIANSSNYPSVKDLFRQAASEEQNHAIWFLYYLVNHNWLQS